jgi:hypothetical protein
MKRTWTIAALCALALFLLLLVIVTSGQPDVTAVELARVLLAWPTIVGALLVGFGIVFRDDFSQFLRNISKVRFPGGAEIERQPPAPEIDEAKLPEEDIPASPEAEDEEQNVLLGVARQSRKEALYWFFMYLNLFLVPTTQEVLAWIGTLEGVTKDLFDASWAPSLPQPIQRAATLNALLQTNLVQEMGGLLRITERGRRYLLFRAGSVEEAVA